MMGRAGTPGSGSALDNSITSPARRWSDLLPRILSGVVLVVLALGTAFAGGQLFALFWLLAAAAILWEWQRMIGLPGALIRFGLGALAIALAVPLVSGGQVVAALGILAAATVGLAFLARPGFRVAAATGLVYAGALVVAVCVLRFSLFPFGLIAILWLFAVVWATDIMAYFGGRLIGGPKLWPRVSPSKTWSGTICGVVAGACVGTFAALRDLAEPTSLSWVFSLSLAAAVLSQAGDAFESAMKRHFGVKDSSHLIPGHGGVMDRLDGFIAAAAFAFVVGLLRGLPSVANGIFYWP